MTEGAESVGRRDVDASPCKAWWAVLVLTLAYALAFVDRTILSLLVEPIKRDLAISDTGVSLLQGLAFALFYTLAGIPIATVADRSSRRNIVAAGIAAWSVMTALCGLAGNFVQLFLARMGVGIGEAALSPAAYSLIADLFPEDRRGRAMAVYASGINLGAGAALLVGGVVVGLVYRLQQGADYLGGLPGWSLVFVVIGLPGLLISLLALTIAEPIRAGPLAKQRTRIGPFIRMHRASVAALFVGLACCATVSAASQAWAPTYFIRTFGYTAPEIGRQLGLILLVAGPLGALCGGALSDSLAARGYPDATMRATIAGSALMVISGPAAMVLPTPELALAAIFCNTFCGSFCYPAGAAALQRLFPASLWARATAIYLLVVALISGIVGPTSVALLTDYLFRDPLRIGASLAIVMGFAAVCATTILVAGSISFRKSVDGSQGFDTRT